MPEASTQSNKRRARAPKAAPAVSETSVSSSRHLNERHLKFLREVGGIVLGVLIALGIGAIADTIAWKVRAHSAEKAARAELALMRGVADERVILQPCLKRRLDDLNAILLDARRTGVLPKIDFIEGGGIRPLPRSAIGVMVDSEIALHVAPARAREYAIINSALPGIDEGMEAEMVGWATLRVLENAPGPIDGDLLASLLIVRAELDYRSGMNGVKISQIAGTAAQMGVAADHSYLLAAGQTWEQSRLDYAKDLLCQPLLVNDKPFVAPA